MWTAGPAWARGPAPRSSTTTSATTGSPGASGTDRLGRGLQREVARRPVLAAEPAQRRDLRGAQFLGPRAAGAENAAGGRVERGGQLAGDPAALGPLVLRVRHRDRGQQPRGVRVGGALVHVRDAG